jgi:hypothetical protein
VRKRAEPFLQRGQGIFVGLGRNSLQLTMEVVFCLHQGGLVELNNSADSLYGYRTFETFIHWQR